MNGNALSMLTSQNHRDAQTATKKEKIHECMNVDGDMGKICTVQCNKFQS